MIPHWNVCSSPPSPIPSSFPFPSTPPMMGWDRSQPTTLSPPAYSGQPRFASVSCLGNSHPPAYMRSKGRVTFLLFCARCHMLMTQGETRRTDTSGRDVRRLSREGKTSAIIRCDHKILGVMNRRARRREVLSGFTGVYKSAVILSMRESYFLYL